MEELQTRKGRRGSLEEAEQKRVFEWLKLHFPKPYDALIFACPNGGKRPGFYRKDKNGKDKWTSPTGKKLKDMGVKKGVPDIIGLIPWDGWHGFIIEMKRKGMKPTPEQENFLLLASKFKYKCGIAYNYLEAREFIYKYFGIERMDELNGRL